MKVLCLSHWYPNSENPVLGTFVHEQAIALRRLGVELRVVQPIPRTPFPVTLLKESYRRLAQVPAAEVYEGFPVRHPRYITLPEHFLYERVGRWMYEGIKDTLLALRREWHFEIIHAHTTYPCGFAANLCRQILFPDVKVVHTIHRYCIVEVPTYNGRCYANVRASLEGADANVFVSLEGQRLAMDYTEGHIADTSSYITNGVDTDKFSLTEADRQEVASLKQQHANTWNLVFVGYVREVKGIKELLSAIHELKARGRNKIRLFLVGGNRLGSYVEDFLAANGLRESVVCVGMVPHDRVKVWMKFADAFVLPSHSEGLPTVLFESLFTGTPSIFTRVGGVGDIVTDRQEALLIPAKSVPAIVEAVETLMDDEELCRRMSAQGRELIRTRYTWKRNAEEHVRLYERLLGGAPERAGADR